MTIFAEDPFAAEGRPSVGNVTQPAPAEPPTPDLWMGAAFRESGPLGSVARQLGETGTLGGLPAPVPGYSPSADEENRPYLMRHGDALVGARSPDESRAIRSVIDKKEADDQLLASSGHAGTVASMALGMLDPTLWFLPGGQAMKAGARGYSVARSAASIGAAGLAQGAIGEAITRATDPTRTFEESAFAISASTVLSGILGAGAASLLTGAESRTLARSLAADKQALASGTALGTVPPIPPQYEGAVGAAKNLRETALFRTGEDVAESTSLPGSAGAAASDAREARPASYLLERVPGLSTAIEKMDPTLRILNSRFTTARRAGADLFEFALETVDNAVGRATAQRGIGAAETEIQLARRQATLAMSEVFDDAWKRHVFGSADAAPIAAAERIAIGSALGRDDRMTREAFNEAVGQAMRRGDQSDLPAAAESARWLRENVFEPWKDRAIKAGYLPEDVEPSTAASYFMRVYNKEKIRARPDAFVNTTADWLESEQTRKAELQSRLEGLDSRRSSIVDDSRKLQAKLDRLDERQKELEARSAERSMETGRTAGRVEQLQERLADQGREIQELEDAIGILREQATDPAQRERIAALKKEASDLAKRERQSRMTPAAMDRAEESELRGAFLRTEEDETFADMVLGRRNPPKEPSFVDFIAKGGGIRDDGGDVASAIGGDKGLTRKLIGTLESPTADRWAERLADEFPAAFPAGRPEPNVVLDALSDAIRGKQPDWFLEGTLTGPEFRLVELGRVAKETRDEMGRLGYDTGGRLDVARFLRDHFEPDAAGPRPFDDIPESIRLEAGLGALERETGAVAAAREAITASRSRVAELDRAAGRNIVRLGEARAGARANDKRLDTLAERQAIAARYREVLDAALKQSDEMHVATRTEMEGVLKEWGGNSAREAVSALRAREKTLAERDKQAASGLPAGSGRLASADPAVDSAVKKILGTDRNLSRQEIEARSREIMDRIISSPDGRLPYADASPSGGGFSQGGREAPRGALARRTFQIPDETIEEFLESDAEHVSKTFLRGVVPEIVLTERFGDPLMTEDFRKILDEAQSLAKGKDEAEATAVFKERDAAIRDLAAVRDRIRGTYAMQGPGILQSAGRASAVIRNFNTLADLGGSTLSSMPDLAGVVFRYGFGKVFADAWAPFLRGLVGAGDGWKLAKEQYRAMGIASELATASRSVAFDDLAASYKPQSRLERGMQAGAEKMQIANLQAPWTDFAKTISAIVSGNEILRAAKAVAEGGATEKQLRDLASSSIEAGMARKIWASFQGAGGNIVDGVHLPNTGSWGDRNARLAFEGAVMRETNITVVTPGQEKPLWMSTPVLSLLGQHKSFVVASTQRILLANLQRRDAATLSGLVTAVSAGMLSAALYSLNSGKEMPEDLSQWVKEGISRSGTLGWLDEANNIVAKGTRGGVDAYRLVGADKPLSRFSSQSIVGMLLGPTTGKIDALTKITGAPFSEEGWDARTTEAARRLAPLQNLIGVRRLLNEVEDATNEAFGITPLERK